MSKFAQFYRSLVNQKELRNLNLFWIGFLIYTLAYTLSTTTLVNYIFCQVIEFVGLAIFISAAFSLVRLRIENNYIKVLFILYICWLFTIVVRGFSLDSTYLKNFLFDSNIGVFTYLTPFVLLFPQNLSAYKKLCYFIFIVGVFYLFYDLIFIKQLLNRDVEDNLSKGIIENFARNLGLPVTFLILTYTYQPKKVKYFTLFVGVVTALFALIRARRGLVFTSLSPFILAYIIYLSESKQKAAVFLISLFSLCLVGIYGLQFFNESSMFSSFKSRVKEDTRTSVEDCFYSDMTTKDWIIGKGINGQYYCPNIDVNDTTGYRQIIETDYLNIILKGGIISLGLLLLITVPAVIKGIFYSNNVLSKAAGCWILIWLLSLYPTTVYVFTLNYIIVWLCIGICYNKRIRDMAEDSVKYYFFNMPSGLSVKA